MYPEPLLVTQARAYLEGQGGLPEVLDCAEKTRQSVEQHGQEMQARLHNEPAHVQALVEPEVKAWLESHADFLRWARIAAESAGASAPLEALCQGLPVSAQRFHFDEFRLSEALWVSRGPTTMAFANRALAASQAEEDLAAVCQREAELLGASFTPFLQGYPLELQEPLAARLEEMLEWLEQPPAPPDVAAWRSQGEQIGKELGRYDLSFLLRGYSAGPTTYGPLNLALNACWLQPQGFVAPELTQFCLQDALTQLEGLAPPEGGEVPEIFEDMEQLLGQLLKLCQRGEDLTAVHQAASEVAQEFQQALEVEEQARCPVCNQAQPLGTRRCTMCGSAMSTGGAEQAPQERLDRVLSLAEARLQGEEVDLEKELTSYRRDLDKARSFQDPDYQEILAQYSEGLAALEEFVQEPGRELLDEAAGWLRQAETRLKSWKEAHPEAD
ncbi:MAG: hypothetical protein KF760_31410 [Candidatus Eremiobacteraeota bacterium]|nr:hypothetical protein [Candidatus Eremiobacteraeota bacterium]MCW5870942.1 hypothetical protein [Candidatus Eremiobacteraeota bacterium]